MAADLPLHEISEDHMLPNGCAKATATKKGARKLSEESHDSVMAEIFRRKTLEEGVHCKEETEVTTDNGASDSSYSSGNSCSCSNSTDNE